MSGIFSVTKAVYVNTLATVNNITLATNIASSVVPLHALVLKSESLIEITKAIEALTLVNPEAGAALKLQVTSIT